MPAELHHNELLELEYEVVDIDKVDDEADILDYGIMEKGKPNTALVLYGWDEIGEFDKLFFNPVYIKFTS